MPSKTSREKDTYLTDLDYADDIALTAMLLQDAQDHAHTKGATFSSNMFNFIGGQFWRLSG